MTRAVIVAVEAGDEPLLLRGLFEAVGIEVHLRRIGRPSEILSAFSFHGQPADIAVLSAHGDADGLILPEMAPGVDATRFAGDRLRPADFVNAQMGVHTVISTACGTGTEAFAKSVLEAGAHRFVAPLDYSDGAAIALMVNAIVYGAVHRKWDWPSSVRKANELVESHNAFRCWTSPTTR